MYVLTFLEQSNCAFSWINKDLIAPQEIYFIYLDKKEIYCTFKICCIISVLFSKIFCLFHNFIFSCSNNNNVFHKPCTKI